MHPVAPGAPIEVPAARGIVAGINRLAGALRGRGVPVIWVLHRDAPGGTDWRGFFEVFVRPENRSRAAQALCPGSPLAELWPQLVVLPADLRVTKNRYSIAGTKTNVCCESTARDAMMLDYKVVLLSDCTAAPSDEEHRATLENVIQQFGAVLTADEALKLLS